MTDKMPFFYCPDCDMAIGYVEFNQTHGEMDVHYCFKCGEKRNKLLEKLKI